MQDKYPPCNIYPGEYSSMHMDHERDDHMTTSLHHNSCFSKRKHMMFKRKIDFIRTNIVSLAADTLAFTTFN